MELHNRPERRTADGGRDAADPYDDRHRQTKALARYDRQKAAWDRMQSHLMSVTAHSSSHMKRSGGGHGNTEFARTWGNAALNMSQATAIARAKREDFTILDVATATSRSDNRSYAWEGLLRCTNEQESHRLVPIGRACQPYRLYSELHDPNTLPDDHLTFARVVSEEDVTDFQNEPKNNSQRFTQSAMSGTNWSTSSKCIRERAVAQEHVKAALTSNSSTKNQLKDLFVDDSSSLPNTVPVHEDAAGGLSPSTYYEEQLRRFAPYVQQRLGHFLQPRTFLHVEGHRAPYATTEDITHMREIAAADGGRRPESAPSVEFVPPPTPPPQPPQTQLWGSSLLNSRLPSQAGNPGAGGVSGRRAGQRLGQLTAHNEHNEDEEEDGDGAHRLQCGSVSTAEPHHNEFNGVDGEHSNDGHLLRSNDRLVSFRADKESNIFKSEPQAGPAMELSTRSLFFQMRPHELLHGSVTLHNTGTTTIYYSWTVVDIMQEHLRETYEAELEALREDEDSDTVTATGDDDSDSSEHEERHKKKRNRPLPSVKPGTTLPYALLSLTHALAAHQHQARESFFFLSSLINGVVLPGEETVFSFSVRATREGLFQSTYELLTVPPTPERIFVQLRAFVQRDGPSLKWLARPVEEALAVKVALDAQRRFVQEMGLNTCAIQASELQNRIAKLDGAAEVARQAEKEKRHTQAEAWNRANRLTFDHVPYHAAVYDKLEKLSAVVRDTYVMLSKREDGTKGGAATQSLQPMKLKGGAATVATSDGAAAVPAASETPQKPQPASLSTTSSPVSAALASPLHQSPSTDISPPQQFPSCPSSAVAAPSPANIEWDGALLPLLYQIMNIRDNATRQVFFEALQVLLRAARASRDVVDEDNSSKNRRSSGSGNTTTAAAADKSQERPDENDEEEEEGKEVPLSVLFVRAATAHADAVVARQKQMVEKQFHDFFLHPVRPVAALSLAPALPNEGVVAGGPGKGRVTSSSALNANNSGGANYKGGKKNIGAPGSSRGARASIVESREGKGGASAVESGADATSPTTPAQRLLLDVIPSAALEGFSVSQATAETTLLKAAEERVVRARMESELADAKKSLTALCTTLFREAVDAACNRTPLATCTQARLAELREIQQSTPMVVDMTLDPLVTLPVGKPGKRK